VTGTGRPEPLLTPDDVCVRLGIPKNTLYRWRSEGKGPPAYRIGKHLRYRREDVEKWLEQHRDDWG
jgi:excisionase family DNA binding protein